MAEASDFKFGTRLGFAKAHHKIPHQSKSGRVPGLGELTKILEFPFNISAKVEASNSKFGMHLRFPIIIKSHPGESGRGLGLGKLPNIWVF